MHSLLCWYCMRLSCLYYVIWTFHVLSLYIMFLSHLLFLCVAVYLSRLLSSLTISSLFFFSNCNFNYERERAFEIHVKRSRTVKSCFVFLRTYTHTHHRHDEPRGVRYRGDALGLNTLSTTICPSIDILRASNMVKCYHGCRQGSGVTKRHNATKWMKERVQRQPRPQQFHLMVSILHIQNSFF